MWIFGYGSLVWRPAFRYAERWNGYVRGYKRRFWQGSPDHRGVPGAPGRVVTLLPDPQELTWGAAFRVEGHEAEEILDDLNHREKAGYEHHWLTFHAHDERRQPVKAIEDVLVFIARPDNPSYLGPAPVTDMAAHIARSTGPSGPNTEYLLELARALREMGADDPHVFELERELQRLLRRTA